MKGRANQIALEKFSQLNGWRVYLCGQPDMVLQTKKMAYLQGASLKDIYADAFLS
jgi:NAD(P)H-flavin reductase